MLEELIKDNAVVDDILLEHIYKLTDIISTTGVKVLDVDAITKLKYTSDLFGLLNTKGITDPIVLYSTLRVNRLTASSEYDGKSKIFILSEDSLTYVIVNSKKDVSKLRVA